MTIMAPYRENRFQSAARRFAEFCDAKPLRPLAIIGGLCAAYVLISMLLLVAGYSEALNFWMIVCYVVLAAALVFFVYGMRQKRRKSVYEFEEALERMRTRLRSSDEAILSEVVKDDPPRPALGN